MKLIDEIHKLPERTVEDLRAKVNCYQASAMDCRRRGQVLAEESACYQAWADTTFMKLRDKILARRLR